MASRLLLAPVLATALVLGAASAEAQLMRRTTAPGEGIRQFPVAFLEPDTLRLEFHALQAGEDLRLKTTGTDTVRVRLRVLDTGSGRPLSRLLALPQDRLFSPGNALLELRSTVPHDSVVPGEYSGTVQLLDRDSKLVGERPLRVTVPARVRPAERQWAVTVYKFTVFAGWRAGFSQQAETRCAPRDSYWTSRFPDPRPAPCVRDNVLPLRLPARDAAYLPEAFRTPSEAELLGVIENKAAKDHAMVWWTGNPLGAPPKVGSPGVEMQFVGMDEPGEYTGTIQLPPAAGSGPVALSVKVTHHWTLVLLPIMLGVALSMWLRRYVRKRQALLALRERSTQLVVRAEQVDRRLTQLDDEVEDAARLRVDVAVADRLRQVNRRIRVLALSRAPAERNDAERDAIDAEVTALEATLGAWEELVDALRRVGELLREFDDVTARLPGRAGLGDVPALRGTAVAVLKTAALDTNDAVYARCVLATQQADLLERWSVLAEEAVRLGAAKAAGVDAAAAALFAAADVAALEEVDRSLHRIASAARSPRPRSGLFRLRLSRRQTAVQDAADADAEEWTAAAPQGRPFRDLGRRVSHFFFGGTPAERVARQAWIVRSVSELAAGVLAFAVAAVTALSELYTAKPYFGTLDDYVVAVLWGFGTKLGIDAVRVALEGGVAWPFRRKPGGGEPAAAAAGAGAPAKS
ncbi:MAG TPA: hypothetical protein VHG08_05500 [Longimicrobium sp.]|nr:hypothetical protein [Longimicrobium sp.]